MSNETTRIFVPEGNNDALTTAALMNNGMGMGGGWPWIIVLLAALRNGGIFGNDGGNGYHSQLSQIQDTLNTNQGNTLIMDAIKGNSTAIGQLSQTIGCNQNALIGALNSIQSAISNYANQNGMSFAQVANQVSSGNMQIINTLQSCCCDMKTLMTNLNYEGRLADQAQTAFIGGKIDAQTTLINDKFCQLELRGVQDKLDQERAKNLALTNQLSQEHQNATFAAMLSPIKADVEEIKSKQPTSVTIPYSPVVGVPSCVAWNAALYGGYPYGAQRGNVFS